MALIGGKKSVDSLAKQFGVSPATIESWRDTALEGISQALRKFSVRLRPRVARDLLCGFLMLAALDSIVKRCVRSA